MTFIKYDFARKAAFLLLLFARYMQGEPPAVQTSLDKETQTPKTAQVQTSFQREVRPPVVVVCPSLPAAAARSGSGVSCNVVPAMSQAGEAALLKKVRDARGGK